jgi:hypothetical protein
MNDNTINILAGLFATAILFTILMLVYPKKTIDRSLLYPAEPPIKFELRAGHKTAFGYRYTVNDGTNVGYIHVREQLPFGAEYRIIVVRPE